MHSSDRPSPRFQTTSLNGTVNGVLCANIPHMNTTPIGGLAAMTLKSRWRFALVTTFTAALLAG
jgi:hypothetical protein